MAVDEEWHLRLDRGLAPNLDPSFPLDRRSVPEANRLADRSLEGVVALVVDLMGGDRDLVNEPCREGLIGGGGGGGARRTLVVFLLFNVDGEHFLTSRLGKTHLKGEGDIVGSQ